VKEWCIPAADAEFVAKMEDVLEVYQRPYSPLNPVVCIDETNKQLIKEHRIACEPGQPEKVDSEYVRNGVADIFMICEPLAGKRETVVKKTRTALDFAKILQYTSDALYPRAEKIVLVTDNLNTHAPASHSTRHSRRRRRAGWRNVSSGIIPPSMGVGWIWPRSKLDKQTECGMCENKLAV